MDARLVDGSVNKCDVKMATNINVRFQGRFSTGNNRLLTTATSTIANPVNFVVQGNLTSQTRDYVYLQATFSANDFLQFTLPGNTDVAFGGPHCFVGFEYDSVKYYIASDKATMVYDAANSEYDLYMCGICVPFY